jgi:hypothetical protein
MDEADVYLMLLRTKPWKYWATEHARAAVNHYVVRVRPAESHWLVDVPEFERSIEARHLGEVEERATEQVEAESARRSCISGRAWSVRASAATPPTPRCCSTGEDATPATPNVPPPGLAHAA